MLNWNGRHLLEESLPALWRVVERGEQKHQVLVVDNGSSDDSVAYVNREFPQFEVLQLDRNYGFGNGNNRGVEAARNDVVVLLNNDMIVSDDFLDSLLEPFRDPSVFAVSSQILFPPERRREETGNTAAHFEKGYLHLSHNPVERCHHTRRYLPVLWAGGGSSAFDRHKFQELGGFSDLYSPCYLEDTDLSYRAWRRGWKVLFSAESRVLHKHRSSSSVRFQDHELNRLIEERKLWYLWKNFQLRTLLPHFILFPFNLTEWLSPATYIGALRKVPAVLLERFAEPVRESRDREIFSWANHPLQYLNHWDEDRTARTRSSGSRLRILIVSAYLPHLGTHGGAGRVFQFLSRVAKKHDVSLVTFTEDSADEIFLEQPRRFCRRVETVRRRQFRPLSFYPYEPFEEFNCPAFREKLEQVLTEQDFDIVHFEWPQMVLYSNLLPDTRTIMTEIEVNYAAQWTLVQVQQNPLKRIHAYYRSLQTMKREVEMCGKIDRVICVTSEDREYLNHFVPAEKLHVINTGVDTSFFSYQPDGSEPNAIVFVGAFRHSPNVDAMEFFCEKVFPSILAQRPNTHLYIVGSSPPDSITRLGDNANITVTGFVEDIRDYYRRAQVVIVPLRTGVGIRGKILEGWSSGRAMVATRLACQGIHAVHGENIMIADRPEEFTLWTLALLRNPDFCARLGINGRKTAELSYDWDNLGEKMIQFYEGLVDAPK
jgi:GT2 family glycosyltransferase/glycosyltransferase involved in cell wall biosynthesis